MYDLWIASRFKIKFAHFEIKLETNIYRLLSVYSRLNHDVVFITVLLKYSTDNTHECRGLWVQYSLDKTDHFTLNKDYSQFHGLLVLSIRGTTRYFYPFKMVLVFGTC